MKNDYNEKLVLHLKYLEKTHPYQLLKNKLYGKEPTSYEKSICDEMMNQLGLSPGICNVIIEYVLSQNDGYLSRKYCEMIASSMVRKKIRNAMEAYESIKNYFDMKRNEKVVHKIETDSEIEKPSQDEFEELLKELTEGKI